MVALHPRQYLKVPVCNQDERNYGSYVVVDDTGGQLEQLNREIVALRDYLDLSYEEIAATLRIPLGTVMSRLHRARVALRQRVQARLGREVTHG